MCICGIGDFRHVSVVVVSRLRGVRRGIGNNTSYGSHTHKAKQHSKAKHTEYISSNTL